MQKQRIVLIIGVVLALTALFLVKTYVEQQRETVLQEARTRAVREQASQTAVLVAKKDILKGAAIEADSLDEKVVPNQYIQPQAVTSFDRIAGMVAVASIARGEQITLTKLSYPRERGGLAEVTPVGKRAVTISVDNISSLAGMIKAGDYVDVLAILPLPVQMPDGKQTAQAATMPLFQNVLVLAVGQEIGAVQESESRYKDKTAASPLITLALAPQEANLIAFVQEQGKIRLILRSPSDSKIEPTQPVSWDALFQYIMPRDAGVEPAIAPSKEEESVEIYRGLSKEKLPLKK